jgi:hypothetical protein
MDEERDADAAPADEGAPGGDVAPSAGASRPDDDDPAFEAKIVRAFIRDGRLVTIPAREKRRQVIYRYLRDQVFTEDRPYPEKEVNQRLALFHPDVATIRRGMVDAGLVTRDAGEYRRA